MADQRVPMTFRDMFSDDPFFKSTWDDFERAREKMMKESRDMWKRFEEDGSFSNETMRPSRSAEKGSKNSRMESSSRTYESRSSSNLGSSSSRQEERTSRNNNGSSSRTRQEDLSGSGRTSRNNNEGSSRTRQQEEMPSNGRSSRKDNDGLRKKYEERSSRRSEKEATNEISGQDWMVPPSFMFPKIKGLGMNMNDTDNEVITVTENDDKFEVSLNTSKYKPSELQVNVGGGVITVEGKHEEKSEDGNVMVSRQFSRQYSLPEGAKPTKVVSNLSSDGVLVVTAPKDRPAITEGQRSVPIAV